jgi:hypothetical protein
VSVKLTPEICINKASSNSRLTAVGRWATASDSHSQNCLQTLSFFLFSFDETTIELYLHAEKLTETVLHLNLGHFVGFFFVLCCFVWFGLVWVFSPMMKQWQNYFWDTISRIVGWRTNNKIIKTQTSLHLNLENFFPFIYFLFLFFFYPLCLSNACSAYGWLVHYLSLYISLKLFCFFVLFFLLICLFVFPFFFNFFAISSHPSILNITIVNITS